MGEINLKCERVKEKQERARKKIREASLEITREVWERAVEWLIRSIFFFNRYKEAMNERNLKNYCRKKKQETKKNM